MHMSYLIVPNHNTVQVFRIHFGEKIKVIRAEYGNHEVHCANFFIKGFIVMYKNSGYL